MIPDRDRRRPSAGAVVILAIITLALHAADSRAESSARHSARSTQAAADRIVIGHSVQGRPIVAWAYGRSTAHRKILVIGVIHGNEQAGLAITSALRRTRIPGGVQLWIIPELNPDGVAADRRQNAHGVDLNRNFPYRWEYSRDPTFDSGPRPASEPETQAAMRLVERIRPAVTITSVPRRSLAT